MRTSGKALVLVALLFGGNLAGDDAVRVGGEHDVAVADAVRDAVLDAHLGEMREAGITHVPADALPAAVREALGLHDGERIPVERFFDPAFQDALVGHGITEALPVESYEPSADVLARPDVRAAIHGAFGPGVNIIATPEVLQALNDHPDDHEKLRDTVEQSIGELPTPMREQLASGFQLPGEARHAESVPFERLPTDEVLAKLDRGSRDALTRFRDLLDDHWALTDAMPTMTKQERKAATKFLAHMRKPSPPPLDSPYARATEQWRKQGYRDAPGAPRGTTLLAAIEQAQRSARDRAVSGNAPTAPAQFDESKHLRGETLASVPDELLAPGSKSHVLAEAGGVVRLYPRSTFDGAVLLVEETEADAFFPREPNLTIAGHPATVSWSLFENGVWTTTVAGYDGSRVHHITVEKKLDGAQRERFVHLAASIIKDASLTR